MRSRVTRPAVKLTRTRGTRITGAKAIIQVQHEAAGTDTIWMAAQVISISRFDAAPSQRFGARSKARTTAAKDREVKPKARIAEVAQTAPIDGR